MGNKNDTLYFEKMNEIDEYKLLNDQLTEIKKQINELSSNDPKEIKKKNIIKIRINCIKDRIDNINEETLKNSLLKKINDKDIKIYC